MSVIERHDTDFLVTRDASKESWIASFYARLEKLFPDQEELHTLLRSTPGLMCKFLTSAITNAVHGDVIDYYMYHVDNGPVKLLGLVSDISHYIENPDPDRDEVGLLRAFYDEWLTLEPDCKALRVR